MSKSISVDPAIDCKVVNTGAAKAVDKIAGKSYSIINDEALRTLPQAPGGGVFNTED